MTEAEAMSLAPGTSLELVEVPDIPNLSQAIPGARCIFEKPGRISKDMIRVIWDRTDHRHNNQHNGAYFYKRFRIINPTAVYNWL